MQLTADIPVAPELPSNITLQRGAEEVIGSGGHSWLQLGYDSEQANRMVAVKHLKSELAGSSDYRERFRREAEWLYRIDDERVPELYMFVDSLEPCIVMEHIEGRSLASRINDTTQDPLTSAECQHIGAEVADVLASAHSVGIVHRDIKPGNIMIDSDDGVHVVDWGIATDRPFWGKEVLASIGVIGNSLTPPGSILGTPGYAAPEMVQALPAGPQVDVYGLAATLFFAVTGHSPAKTTTTVLQAHPKVEELAPLAQLRPDIPAALSETIDLALARNPRERLNPIELKEALLAVAA